MLADTFPMGMWRNLQEMEDSLTLDELELLSEAQYRKEDRHNKFMAAIQGIDLSDSEEETDFEKIKMRAAAELAGKSEEEFVFDSIGIEIEDDDD